MANGTMPRLFGLTQYRSVDIVAMIVYGFMLLFLLNRVNVQNYVYCYLGEEGGDVPPHPFLIPVTVPLFLPSKYLRLSLLFRVV